MSGLAPQHSRKIKVRTASSISYANDCDEHEGLATARLAQARRADVIQTERSSNKERKGQSEITFLCICGPAFCQIILAEPHPHNSG
jgi:hypothetical protein